MKIVIDMNLSPQWVLVLEASGYQAVHWSTVGNPKATDKIIIVNRYLEKLVRCTNLTQPLLALNPQFEDD